MAAFLWGRQCHTHPGQRFNLHVEHQFPRVSASTISTATTSITRGSGSSVARSIFHGAGRSDPDRPVPTSLPPGQKGWGSDYKKYLIDKHRFANRVFRALGLRGPAVRRELPRPRSGYDGPPSGMPRIRITFNVYDNEKKANVYIKRQAGGSAQTLAAGQVWSYPDPAVIPVNSHAYGGTRMGDDPAVSVVNKYGISRTRRRTWSCSVAQTGAAPLATTRPRRSTRTPGSRPITWPRTSRASRSSTTLAKHSPRAGSPTDPPVVAFHPRLFMKQNQPLHDRSCNPLWLPISATIGNAPTQWGFIPFRRLLRGARRGKAVKR